jgi:hypothetical protein
VVEVRHLEDTGVEWILKKLVKRVWTGSYGSVVSTVMNLWGSWMTRNFLITWATIIFSRRYRHGVVSYRSTALPSH